MIKHHIKLLMLLSATLCFTSPLGASPLHPGSKTITLVAEDGSQLPIGVAEFSKSTNGVAFTTTMTGARFGDYFLSMRPFRCIDTAQERLCHQPYPYALVREISADDLTALEYELMFIFQTPDQFNSVDAWNGLYYKLRIEGDSLIGDLHAVDLNLIMAPPEKGEMRPIKQNDLTAMDADSHPYYRVVIK
jgi:hypothetical protein